MRTLTYVEPTKLYFTSDLHLGHFNIIRYCNRPFNDVGHMNKTIIENWCKLITDEDIVFILGDFCMLHGRKSWNFYLDQLPGHKILIQGNHDKMNSIPVDKFDGIYNLLNINIKDSDVKGGEQRITLCHYPMLSWHQSHRGAWQLFGHMHNSKLHPTKEHMEGGDEVADFLKFEYKYSDKLRSDQYDVGVDGNDFTPISYYQIKKIIQKNLELSK